MKLDIYDLHSGIRDIEWEIRDVEDNALVYGGGRAPVHVHASVKVIDKPTGHSYMVMHVCI